jgi:hypothetical protein
VKNNLLNFFATIITPWINIFNGRLKQGDWSFLMTTSTLAKRWMKTSNFDKQSKNLLQVAARVDVA